MADLMLSFLALHSTAFLAPAPLHIAKPPVPPRAAVSAIFDNEKDIRNVAVNVLACAVILASPTPAFAKGGGHGGGGGGGHISHSSHSSHSSSTSSATRSLHSYSRYASPKPASVSSSSSLGQGRRGSSSRRGKRYSSFGSSYSPASSAATLAPPPPDLPALLFPSEGMAREQGGYYCPAEPPLPRAGEKLKVAGRKVTVVSSTPRVALYGSQLQTIPGLDADCSVTVQYDDDGTTETLSAAEKAQPLWVKYLDLELVGGAYGGLGLLSALETSAWEKEEKRHDAMLEELKPSGARHPARPTPVRSCPKSGEYWGSSEESDEGDQSVRSTITFDVSGAVRGRGVDGEDGRYTITKGVWGRCECDKEHEVSVGWIEEYDEGFAVVVEGFYSSETGKIEARFRSNRGVSGRFMLAPKPSIFS